MNAEESKECHTRHTELSQGLAVRRESVSDTDLEGVTVTDLLLT